MPAGRDGAGRCRCRLGTLRGPGSYTVFAPSDDAFKAVPARALADLGNDKALLKSVLSDHVLPIKVPAADVKNANAKTVNGSNALSRAGATVTIEEAMVVRADVAATNRGVHVIDRVLLSPKQ